MISSAMVAAIEDSARRYNLPPQLIKAIVLTESSGDIHAWKVEPAYRYLVDCETGKPFRALTAAENASERAPADFPRPKYSSRDTEWWGQQASWGPMQVMGAVARELGYRQPFPALCTIAYGIDIGCQHLSNLRGRFLERHSWFGVAAAYNAGSPRYDDSGKFVNEDYVTKIAFNGGFN